MHYSKRVSNKINHYHQGYKSKSLQVVWKLGHNGHPFLFDHSFTTFAPFYTCCKKESHWKENEIQRKMLFIWHKTFTIAVLYLPGNRVFQFSETITRKRNPAESRSNSWRTWLCTKSFFSFSMSNDSNTLLILERKCPSTQEAQRPEVKTG